MKNSKQIIILFIQLISQNIFGQIHEHNMDKNIRPQDDIYYHVNGNWLKITEIPADKSRWGSFDQLRENTDSMSLNLLNQLLKGNYPKGSDEQKIKDLYWSILNFNVRNKDSMYPLYPYFDKIDKLKSKMDLLSYIINMSMEEKDPFLGIYVDNHMKRSSEYAVYLGNSELGLGRDYYQKNDTKSKETLEKYTEYIDILYRLIFKEESANFGSKYVNFEKSIAKTLLTVEESRNPDLQYNPIAVKEFNSKISKFPIEAYLKIQNYNVDTVIIGELNYYKSLDDIIDYNNLNFLKKYLKIQLLNQHMKVLSMDLDSIHFEFYGKYLSGKKKQQSIEKRALKSLNETFGETLGKIYVKHAFPPKSKEIAIEMVEYLKKSFRNHIKELTWMSSETKEKALLKLQKITVKIGYPDKWKDYSIMDIKGTEDSGSYFSNMREYHMWNQLDAVSRVGKSVNRLEWGMNPQTVNAYYNPLNNEIVFPAAILQPPFFNPLANPAINFGGIGAVIGHEITHGFDDGGCQFDGDGNLNNWWTPIDMEKFKLSTKSLVEQFNKYEPLPGVFVNGEFTLGENIADLGGVSVAFDALKLYLKDHPSKKMTTSDYSIEKEFFMSWSTIWRAKLRDEELINKIKTDPHSPGYYRAIGPLTNLNAFYKTFNLQPTDKMYKAKSKRITIW